MIEIIIIIIMMTLFKLRTPTGGRLTSWLFTHIFEELNAGLSRTNPDSSRVEDFNQRPPDFKSSALNHSAMLPP